MKNFYEKIQQIESLLSKSKKFKDKNLLATAIYFKLRLGVPFRKVPLKQVPFSWYNLRYWLQKLKRDGTLTKIQNIVEGD